MSIGYILLWLVGFSSGAVVLQILRGRSRKNRGWLIVNLLILGVMASLFQTDRDLAGFVGAGLWFLLVLLPNMGVRAVQGLCDREKYGEALWLSRAVTLLHPADGWRDLPAFLRPLALDQHGKTETFESLLTRFGRSQSAIARTILAVRFGQRREWEELILWVRSTQNIWTFTRSPPS